LRALEPLNGLATMARRRDVTDVRKLCAGPGRLSQALGIAGEHDGLRLDRGPIRIRLPDQRSRARIQTGPRIGISRATDWPLRFYLEGPWISR
jgi:DNA-3-methyladenine glycosylase